MLKNLIFVFLTSIGFCNTLYAQLATNTGNSLTQPILISPSNQSDNVSTLPKLIVQVLDTENDSLQVIFFLRKITDESSKNFILIGVPDTQFYTSSLNGGSPEILKSQTEWIVDNKDSLNIAFVAQLGDCVQNGDNNGNEVEWINVDSAWSLLEDPLTTFLPDGIPYGLAVGNRDQSPPGSANGTTTLYNKFFGIARFENRSYYGGHFGNNNNNHYEYFNAGGMEFIVIYLEFDTQPNMDSINWADNLLKTHSNKRAIIVSHFILESDASFSNQGQTIYNALKDNGNVFLMLCGHIGVERRREDTFNGNLIHSVLSNYQDRVNGGDGWLRIMEFTPADNEIRVKTYSPFLNDYENDLDSEFSLNYDMRNSYFTPIATLQGSGQGNEFMFRPSLLAETDYEWYVDINIGETSIAGPTWRFSTRLLLAAPIGLSAIAEDGRISLNWFRYLDFDLSSYNIYRNTSNDSLNNIVRIDSISKSQTAYIDTSVINGIEYFYWVSAFDSAGNESLFSEGVSAIPLVFLSVEFFSFSATLNKSIVSLHWQTQTETNNYGFEVDRFYYSNWQTIGFVKGKGTSTIIHSYSFSDNIRDLFGEIKYRLKQIDFNGTFSYSEELIVTLNDPSKAIKLSQNYPNPFLTNSTIYYSIPRDTEVTLDIYDLQGRLVSTLIHEFGKAGNYKVNVNALLFPSGLYFYKLTTGEFTEIKKFVIIR